MVLQPTKFCCIVNDYHEAGDDMNHPPECADGSNRICLSVSLTNLLTEGLCPYSPPLSHPKKSSKLTVSSAFHCIASSTGVTTFRNAFSNILL